MAIDNQRNQSTTGGGDPTRDNPNRTTGQGGSNPTGTTGKGEGGGDVRFRCSDVGQNCPWEVRGNNESEIMPKIEQHGREKHNIAQFDNETRDRVRGAIRRAA